MATEKLVQIASGVLDYPDLETTDAMLRAMQEAGERGELFDNLLEYRQTLLALTA